LKSYHVFAEGFESSGSVIVKYDENVGKVGQVVFERRRPVINDVCDINHRTKISTEDLKIITTKFMYLSFMTTRNKTKFNNKIVCL
jgi:hypothetical protein